MATTRLMPLHTGDVYKRQGFRRADYLLRKERHHPPCAGVSDQPDGTSDAGCAGTWQAARREPVSYTHLDVYKRQVIDVNTMYFERNGGYEYAKQFYEEAFHFIEEKFGADNVLSLIHI